MKEPAKGITFLLSLFQIHSVLNVPVRERPIVFPNDDKNSSLHQSRDYSLLPSLDQYGKPKCKSAEFSTFCENVEGYPAQDIKELIKFDPKVFQEIFGNAGINSRRTIHHDDISEESVCRHRSQTFLPKMGKNDGNKWRYVVNDIDYVQAVVSEICEKDGKACTYVQNSLPAGYQSICRQRYSYKRLLAIDPDEKKTYMDSFKFPSCCSCFVKVASNFERRMSGRKENRSPSRRSITF